MPASQVDLEIILQELARKGDDIWIADACGITSKGTQMPALVHKDAYAADTTKHRVLVIGGLSGNGQDVRAVERLSLVYIGSEPLKAYLALSVALCGNPDGLNGDFGPANGAGGNPTAGYPPTENFFYDEQNPESRYLWRWVTFMAPDAALEVVVGDSIDWAATDPAGNLGRSLGANQVEPADSILAALGNGQLNGLDTIPGFRVTAPEDQINAEVQRFFDALSASDAPTKSAARLQLDFRRGRSPLDVAKLLAGNYGYTLDPLVYTQGVGISGRLRVGELDGALTETATDIVPMVEPLAADIESTLQDASGQHLAGLVWCDELASATGDQRYMTLLISAADRFLGQPMGDPPTPCDHDYRTEDMFFAAAVLGRAFKATGNASYIDVLSKFLLGGEVQQPDGLFWHADDVPFFWGRGNGFAAMGFAETLTYMDDDHADRAAVLSIHLRHLEALRDRQHSSGMLTQLLDYPGSYHEHTATSMVGYAVARGLRLGWLDDSFRPFAQSLWTGASERIDAEGGLVDGCSGTGPQLDIRAYLDRPATYGFDDRTGNLALWFAVEMARLPRA
ncbi:MAG: glycoside hydrolase family 88 protein [Chloroflexi bacterium]|nr:glycoside hydrolase family 88 protein [Chloroflexota bacterium]